MTRWPLQDLARMKLELREAVQNEAFERAAKLRDKIQDLERRLTSRPEKSPRSMVKK